MRELVTGRLNLKLHYRLRVEMKNYMDSILSEGSKEVTRTILLDVNSEKETLK